MAEKQQIYEIKLGDITEYIDNELKIGQKITDTKINGLKHKLTESFLLIPYLYGKIEILERQIKEEKEKGPLIPPSPFQT